MRHYEGHHNYGYGNYGQGEVQDKDESESGSSYGSHAEDTEEGNMEFLKGLIARRPFATGEQLLEDFLDVWCTEEDQLKAAFGWAAAALNGLGYLS